MDPAPPSPLRAAVRARCRGEAVKSAWWDASGSRSAVACTGSRAPDTSRFRRTGGGGGVEGGEGDCDFTLERPNPRTCEQAIAAAREEALLGDRNRKRWCLAFVAEAYGWGASGEPTANAAWRRLHAAGQTHPHDPNVPAGALLFYATGDDAGHVALHLGDDQVATNDIAAPGRIDIVPLDQLTHGSVPS